MWFSYSSPGRKSPNGIQVDSPVQRQWMSFDSIGSMCRIASIVRGCSRLPPGAKVEVADDDLQHSHPRRIAWPRARITRSRPAPTISTHVLDTERGVPAAAGVHVTLYKLVDDGRPLRLTQALTDDDGRVRDLLERPLTAGDYRLEFDLASDFAGDITTAPTVAPATAPPAAPADRFFRRLTLDLRVTDTKRSYHVPLLLAPFAMTMYFVADARLRLRALTRSTMTNAVAAQGCHRLTPHCSPCKRLCDRSLPSRAPGIRPA